MMRYVLPFLVVSFFLACSKNRPVPVAPAGKITDTDLADFFAMLNQIGQAKADSAAHADSIAAAIADSIAEAEAREAIESEFHIELAYIEYSGHKYPLTDKEKQLVRKAADFWEQIIVGDMPDHTLTEDEKLLLGGHAPPGTDFPSIGSTRNVPSYIDDLRIYVWRDDVEYNYIPPCNGTTLRNHGIPVARIEIGFFLNEYGYFGSSSDRRSKDIYWSEDRFVWQTAHEIGHAILGYPTEENESLYRWDKIKSRVKRESDRLTGIYYIGEHACQIYEEITGQSHPRGIDIRLWFKEMGPPGFHGWSLHEMMLYWPPPRFHWPSHPVYENTLMAQRTPREMPLDVPPEVSEVTRAALVDLGYEVR